MVVVREEDDVDGSDVGQPAVAGTGQYLPLVGDLLSFSDIVSTLNQLGHRYTFSHVPANVFATFFPGAGEVAETLGYFERHTCLGAKSDDRIAVARTVAGRVPPEFPRWARANMLVMAA